MAVVPSPDPAGFFIALHEGLFARQGLLWRSGQGATSSFPVQGCAVTEQWAAVNPGTLAAFRAAPSKASSSLTPTGQRWNERWKRCRRRSG